LARAGPSPGADRASSWGIELQPAAFIGAAVGARSKPPAHAASAARTPAARSAERSLAASSASLAREALDLFLDERLCEHGHDLPDDALDDLSRERQDGLRLL